MPLDFAWIVGGVAGVLLTLGFQYVVRNSGSGSMQDPYGSFHIALNTDQHPDPKQPPTEWLNMGYWEHTNKFPEACEALALRLIASAGCIPGGRVLDVGHGSGDSLLVHLQNPSIARPSLLAGITSLAAHHQRSKTRVHECQIHSTAAADVKVELFLGDAIYRGHISTHTTPHPLDPNGIRCFDSILALDCAYHFRTRHTFLQQCFAHLSPGGKVALADICFRDDSPPPRLLRSLLGFLGVMPSANAITQRGYMRTMSDLGYEDIRLEDISTHVFPGFLQFLKARGLGWNVFTHMFNTMLVARGASFVIVTGRKPNAPTSK